MHACSLIPRRLSFRDAAENGSRTDVIVSTDEAGLNEAGRLPEDWREIVSEGIDALAWAENMLDRELAQSSEISALLAGIRDVSGLAERLRETRDAEWENGYARVSLTPRDLAILEEWEHRGVSLRNSRNDRLGEARQRAPRFRALRLFLESYLAKEQ